MGVWSSLGIAFAAFTDQGHCLGVEPGQGQVGEHLRPATACPRAVPGGQIRHQAPLGSWFDSLTPSRFSRRAAPPDLQDVSQCGRAWLALAARPGWGQAEGLQPGQDSGRWEEVALPPTVLCSALGPSPMRFPPAQGSPSEVGPPIPGSFSSLLQRGLPPNQSLRAMMSYD